MLIKTFKFTAQGTNSRCTNTRL